jgi:protein TonB
MRSLLTFLLFITITFLFAQETKKKTIENKAPYYKEIFYVLKSNVESKHGPYQKFNKVGLVEKGQFANNEKSGRWEFFDFNGNLVQRYNYEDSTFENVKPFTWIEKFWVIENGEHVEKRPDREPCFIGSMARITRTWKISYPAEARRTGVDGKVMVSATITKDGKMIDEKVEKGIGYGCDEEALRAVQSIPDEWIPGKINGHNVDIRILVPVTFKLE